MNRIWNGIAHFFEWLTIYAFLQNFVMIFWHPQEFEITTPLAAIVGSEWSLGAVAIIFLVLGVCLAASKIFKRKKLHKNALFWTYIVLVYVTILEAVLSGFNLALADNAFLMVGIAYAWLRWKFRTEYINPKDLEYERH